MRIFWNFLLNILCGYLKNIFKNNCQITYSKNYLKKGQSEVPAVNSSRNFFWTFYDELQKVHKFLKDILTWFFKRNFSKTKPTVSTILWRIFWATKFMEGNVSGWFLRKYMLRIFRTIFVDLFKDNRIYHTLKDVLSYEIYGRKCQPIWKKKNNFKATTWSITSALLTN